MCYQPMVSDILLFMHLFMYLFDFFFHDDWHQVSLAQYFSNGHLWNTWMDGQSTICEHQDKHENCGICTNNRENQL